MRFIGARLRIASARLRIACARLRLTCARLRMAFRRMRMACARMRTAYAGVRTACRTNGMSTLRRVEVVAHLLHVVPDLALLRGVAQEVGRVEGRHNLDAAVVLELA